MLKNFIKKYGYYLMAFSLILIVGATVALSSENEGLQGGDLDNSQQTSNLPIEMVCPMKSAQVLKDYSDSELFYNATLKQWESHRGVDLTSEVSSDVVSVLDGVVKSCSYSYEDGYCITIEHSDGLSSVYCSLKDCNSIKEGDEVKRGQKIGEASTSASNEAGDGNHLHFQVRLNGQYVDPSNYLTLGNK